MSWQSRIMCDCVQCYGVGNEAKCTVLSVTYSLLPTKAVIILFETLLFLEDNVDWVLDLKFKLHIIFPYS